jgi:hypothetical protein
MPECSKCKEEASRGYSVCRFCGNLLTSVKKVYNYYREPERDDWKVFRGLAIFATCTGISGFMTYLMHLSVKQQRTMRNYHYCDWCDYEMVIIGVSIVLFLIGVLGQWAAKRK